MKVTSQQFSFELNPQEAFHLKQLVAHGRLHSDKVIELGGKINANG